MVFYQAITEKERIMFEKASDETLDELLCELYDLTVYIPADEKLIREIIAEQQRRKERNEK